MTTRSYCRNALLVRNADGSALLVEDALVSLFQHGTSTPIQAFAGPTGGAPLSQPLRSDARGQVAFWADLGSAQLFDALVASDGLTVRAGTARPIAFDPFTEALPAPSGSGAGSGSVPMAGFALLTKLARGVENASVLVPGDSTADTGSGAALGNATRWPKQWALLIGADWPAYTVAFRQWQDSSGTPTYAWPAPTIIQAGPNGLTTHGSVSGSAASTTITDAAIGSGDLGKRVIGVNIPPEAYVGTVTPGVSYVLVDSPNAVATPIAPWGNVTSVQLGADPVLHIWGASVAATRWLDGFGTHMDSQYTLTRPDLIIADHGHNEPHVIGAFAPSNAQAVFWNNYLDGIGMLEAVCPGVPVMVTAQNPRTDAAGAADAPVKARLIGSVAMTRGYELVDVQQAFYDYGANWAADLLAVDGVHPSPAGSALWAQEVQRHLTVPPNRRAIPRYSPPSLFQTAAPEQLAPGLLDFLANGSLPAGWSLTSATVDVDSVAGVAAAKVISTGVLGNLAIPLTITRVAGQTITATIRVFTTSAASNGAVGIRWTDANGTHHTEQSTYVTPAAVGAWYYQSISKAIPANATDCAIWLYGDAAGTAAPAWYRSLTVHRGLAPAGPIPSAVSTQLVPGAVTDPLVAPTALIQPPKIGGLSPLFSCLGPILPGVAGAYFTTPSVSANRITGVIEIKALLAKGTGCRPAAQVTIGGKWGAAGARSYALQLNSTGAVGISWSVDGTASLSANSNAGVLAATLATDLWVKVTFDPNVAGQYQVKVYTSTDDVTYTQLGTTTNGVTGPSSIFDATTQPVEIGSLGNNSSQFFAGAVLAFTLANSIGGSAAQKFQFTTPDTTTFTATTTEVWTRHGTPTWLFRPTDPFVVSGVIYGGRGLGAGNTAAATTLGSVTRKLPIFAADGSTVLGYVPLYGAIT